jgi:hypothetical protein
MQQFKRFMHESLLCLRNVVASGVCCTKTPTNKHKLNIFLYQQTTRHGIAQMFFEAHVEKHHQRAMSQGKPPANEIRQLSDSNNESQHTHLSCRTSYGFLPILTLNTNILSCLLTTKRNRLRAT